MRKLLFIAMCLLTLIDCKNEKSQSEDKGLTQVDSLQKIIEQKDNEINDIMGVFNEIEEGFRLVNEAEGRITLDNSGESANKSQRMRENITFIQERLAQNRSLIEKLRGQLRESSVRGEQLKRTLDNLVRQLEEKNVQLSQLKAQLEAKDIHIVELDNTIKTLNTDVNNLKAESDTKSKKIDSQDRQLNTAWFVFGTKKELKEQNILVKGKVLQGNFNKNYFTRIDIRVDKEIKLCSKSAKILTMHPAGSYSLDTDSKGMYVLRITNPQLFWSTSKYLVVQVK